MSKRILSWFDRRKRIGTIQLMRKHLELTIGTVEELSKAVKFKTLGDVKLASPSIDRVSNYEREADLLRRRISLEVAQSELPPSERIDLLRLVRVIDHVADWSLEAARILISTPMDRLPSELTDVVEEMVRKVGECVHSVVRCIDKLSEDVEESLKMADQVEHIEEEVDELYQKARNNYPKLGSGEISVGEAILVSQFIDAVESIADWCENSIDQIRVVALGLS